MWENIKYLYKYLYIIKYLILISIMELLDKII